MQSKSQSIQNPAEQNATPTPSLPTRLYNAISSWAYQTYMNSPLNLSSLTGWRYPGIPRLIGYPIVGRLPHFFKDGGAWTNFLEAGNKAIQHPSGMCYYWAMNQLILIVTKPEDIKNLLSTNARHVTRTSFKGFEDQFGTSILSDPHEIWKNKKQIFLKYLYNGQSLDSYEQLMRDNINEVLLKLQTNGNSPVAVTTLVEEFTIGNLASNIITQAKVSADKRKEIIGYLTWINENVFTYKNKSAAEGIATVINYFVFGKTPKGDQKIKEHLKTTLKQIFAITAPEEAEGFVGDIYNLRQSEDDVLGDINTLFFAGADTTASAFQFVIKLLAANPHVAQKLQSELEKNIPNKAVTLAKVNKIDYLDMVISECLRIYPPVPFLAREVDEPFQLGDITVSKKNVIIYSPYLTHRRPDIYDRPEEFNPERFAKAKPRNGYIPFGSGANECVGMRFSRQTLKLLIASIYLNYRVDLKNNNFDVTLKFGGVVAPKTPVEATFTPLMSSHKEDMVTQFKGKRSGSKQDTLKDKAVVPTTAVKAAQHDKDSRKALVV